MNAFSAATHASQVAAGGTYRTGGPRPVQVASTVNVLLDGQPFRQQTVRVVEQAQQRAQWRTRVGEK